jgi:hypothetical protein
MTICAPLNNTDVNKEFTGAFCVDIEATMTVTDSERGNYLQNLYLSGSYSNKTNYIIFQDQSVVSTNI